MENLGEIAAKWGIDTEYVDANGTRQFATATALERISAALEAGGAAPQNLDLASAPDTTYQGHSQARLWLLAVQLYSVRSDRNWGHGDFTDLAALVEIAAGLGAAGIGLNPLHALFGERATLASPYAPNSRLFLNPLYIDVEAIAEFPGMSALDLGAELERLRRCDLVAYGDVGRAKMAALRLAHRAFLDCGSAERRSDFDTFRRERGDALDRFAAFETLRGEFDSPWWHWPSQWRRPTAEGLRELRRTRAVEVGFHEFVQWIADRQLRACCTLARQRGLSIGLYLDVAVGIDAGGADAWSEQDTILQDLSIGAPPDLLNTAGQDWGITSFNPHALIARDFAPFRELLASAMRYAGAIRLDHILGLKRLYVVPRGLGAREGAYLRCPLDSLLAAIAQESQKHRCIVIGEDLGTVPAGFRETLASHGIWSYLVMLFERDSERFHPPERYPAKALATFATHDLPTFAGWKGGWDLQTKRTIGIDPGEAQTEREAAHRAIRTALEQSGSQDDLPGIARFLAATPSRLVAISIEDVLGLEHQVNIPGTVDQYPNWRNRLPVSLEQLKDNELLRQIANIFDVMGRSDKRVSLEA